MSRLRKASYVLHALAFLDALYLAVWFVRASLGWSVVVMNFESDVGATVGAWHVEHARSFQSLIGYGAVHAVVIAALLFAAGVLSASSRDP